MVLTTTYCAVLCINLFFAWPDDIKWNLGEWINANVILHSAEYRNAYVYSNENENITVKVSKGVTVDKCSSYRIKVSKIEDRKPSVMMPGTLGIREFCAE